MADQVLSVHSGPTCAGSALRAVQVPHTQPCQVPGPGARESGAPSGATQRHSDSPLSTGPTFVSAHDGFCRGAPARQMAAHAAPTTPSTPRCRAGYSKPTVSSDAPAHIICGQPGGRGRPGRWVWETAPLACTPRACSRTVGQVAVTESCATTPFPSAGLADYWCARAIDSTFDPAFEESLDAAAVGFNRFSFVIVRFFC